MTHPSYDSKPWHIVLLFWTAIGFAVFVNTIIGRLLPKIESLILVVHILGFFAIILPLIFFGQHQDASEVFGTFLNNGKLPTKGLSFVVGIVGTAFPFLGKFVVCLQQEGQFSTLTRRLGADGAIHVYPKTMQFLYILVRLMAGRCLKRFTTLPS